MNKEIYLLDTTLRDGSYATNFSFTTAATANICGALEKAGIRLIEIGHGVGLNASVSGYGVSAETDEEYLKAASGALKLAKYGMFAIPGIARIEDIDMAADHGMGFIRIGTNVTQVPHSEGFISKAKKYGMLVAANFMKSYTMEPKAFAEEVKRSESYGADMVYIVDSAGGMFPKDIRRYIEAIRKVSNIPLGFHGHDNLGLGVINSIEAVECGAAYIDASLQGLGRSGGNPATEVIVAALLKLGYELDIDLLQLLEAGFEYIQPHIKTGGKMPLDIVAGYADFHSSYMNLIEKYSLKYQIDPAMLIIEICKVNKVDVDEAELDRIAQGIEKREGIYMGRYGFSRYVGNEQNEKK